jgi:hypothetical protein
MSQGSARMPRRDMAQQALLDRPIVDRYNIMLEPILPPEKCPLQKGEEIAWQTASAMPQMILTNATR